MHTTDTLNPPRAGSAVTPKLALTISEAGESLGLSARQIEEMCRAGLLPVARIGRRVLIPVKALSAWLDEQTERAEDGDS